MLYLMHTYTDGCIRELIAEGCCWYKCSLLCQCCSLVVTVNRFCRQWEMQECVYTPIGTNCCVSDTYMLCSSYECESHARSSNVLWQLTNGLVLFVCSVCFWMKGNRLACRCFCACIWTRLSVKAHIADVQWVCRAVACLLFTHVWNLLLIQYNCSFFCRTLEVFACIFQGWRNSKAKQYLPREWSSDGTYLSVLCALLQKCEAVTRSIFFAQNVGR